MSRTTAEKLAFEKEWDARVEAGWQRNGKPLSSTHRGGYPGPSIIGSRVDGYCVCDDGRPAKDCGIREHRESAR